MITLSPLQFINEVTLILEWRNDLNVLPTLRTGRMLTVKDQDSWLKKILRDNTCSYFGIYQDGSLMIGYCGLDKINLINRTAEISILINSNYKNKGIGKISVNKLLEIAFSRYNLNIVFGEVYENNSAIEFWKKCGFTIEGLLRERKYWGNKYHNSFPISIKKDEWLKL